MNLHTAISGNRDNGMLWCLHYFGRYRAQSAANSINLIILHRIDGFVISTTGSYRIGMGLNGIVHMHGYRIHTSVHGRETDVIQGEVVAGSCRALV